MAGSPLSCMGEFRPSDASCHSLYVRRRPVLLGRKRQHSLASRGSLCSRPKLVWRFHRRNTRPVPQPAAPALRLLCRPYLRLPVHGIHRDRNGAQRINDAGHGDGSRHRISDALCRGLPRGVYSGAVQYLRWLFLTNGTAYPDSRRRSGFNTVASSAYLWYGLSVVGCGRGCAIAVMGGMFIVLAIRHTRQLFVEERLQ